MLTMQARSRVPREPSDVPSEQPLAREIDYFTQQQPSLRKRYQHQYVAIFDARVIDADSDQFALYRRVMADGPKAILIRHVDNDYTEPLMLRARLGGIP